jgi:hypothetical protein
MRKCRAAAFSYQGTATELNWLQRFARNGQPWRWQYVRTVLGRAEAAH